MKKIKITVLSVSAVVIGIILITDSKGISDTIRECTETCLDSLIPSLFCFMLFASVLIGSGIGKIITAPIWVIIRYILKLDCNMFSVYLLSQFGGYPIGVKLLNELIRKDNKYKEQAQKAIYYCFSSGPAFVTGIVGIGIYNDITAGIIIYVSCFMANLITAVVTNIKNKTPIYEKMSYRIIQIKISSYLKECIKSLIQIVAAILLFNSIAEVANFILTQLFDINITYIINTLIEITNIKQANPVPSIILSTVFISFGGMCIIYQILTLAEFRIKVINFIAARTIITLLSALICKIIIYSTGYSPSLSVFAYKFDIAVTNPVVAICVICMTGIVLSEATTVRKK